MATEDSAVPMTSNKREDLTCALCLEIFRDPRLLPCSHTFCTKCLDHLIQKHPDGSFPCPTCHKRVEVHAEGSSGFLSNFFINEEELDRARNVTACSVHLQKQLGMFCLDCNHLLCVECKLTAHLHHRSQTLQDARKDAEKQLSAGKAKIEQIKDKVKKMLQKQESHLNEFKSQKLVVEQKIKNLHTTLVAEADRYLKEALESFEEACKPTENLLSADLHVIVGNVPKLNVLEQKMDRALQEEDSCKLISTATDVRRRSRSIEKLEKTNVLPSPSNAWILNDDTIWDDESIFVSMKNFIRQRQRVTYAYTHVEVRINEEFCCGEDDDSVVFSVCPGRKHVLVSFESSYKDKLMTHDPSIYEVLWNLETLKCSSISYRFNGSNNKCVGLSFSKTGTRNTQVKGVDPTRHYSFKTVPRMSEGCVLSHTIEMVNERLITTKDYLFCVDCGPHRAVDTNSAADLFVVVEEPRPPSKDRSRKVRLFRRGQRAAIATYQPPLTPCQPADVCFFILEGQEVLLVADELNNTIHVVEVKDDCMTFAHYLTPDCPLLVQPTALNLDPRGRLWVGCRGGRLFTVQHIKPEEEEKKEDDDNDNGDDDDDGGGDDGGCSYGGGGRWW